MPDCKACGMELIFLKHEKTQKTAPIEAEKHPDGNLVISRERKLYRMATAQEYEQHRISDTGPKLWLSHFARCPAADKFKEPKNQ